MRSTIRVTSFALGLVCLFGLAGCSGQPEPLEVTYYYLPG